MIPPWEKVVLLNQLPVRISQGELYIQSGDAASRRAVRFFTHNSANNPKLRFRCEISQVTTTAVPV